jgi:hypothetical protein
MENTGNSAESLLKRKRRRKAVWAKEVLKFRKSGLTAEEYATKKSLKLKTPKYWVRVLGNSGEAMPKSAGPTFLPVSVLHAVKAPVGSGTVSAVVASPGQVGALNGKAKPP